jgi:hypothetical protein
LRSHIPTVVCLAVTIASFLPALEATAQVLVAPNAAFVGRGAPPSGRFYIQGGVRYREINTCQIQQDAPTISFVDPGAPAFGPSVPGPFGT